jgi:hypothetical protein
MRGRSEVCGKGKSRRRVSCVSSLASGVWGVTVPGRRRWARGRVGARKGDPGREIMSTYVDATLEM